MQHTLLRTRTCMGYLGMSLPCACYAVPVLFSSTVLHSCRIKYMVCTDHNKSRRFRVGKAGSISAMLCWEVSGTRCDGNTSLFKPNYWNSGRLNRGLAGMRKADVSVSGLQVLSRDSRTYKNWGTRLKNGVS
ncbi:hypothetical protein DFH27DRAFT_48820 [Peziza echinospora]|nr:hypothetical protein DFH27DRAFT_48820 [Peziza echinospora]